MITEDYVSFETAKLLKEKGFDVNAINYWHIVPSETSNFEDLEKIVCGIFPEPEYSEDYYPMITIQMAMKWLREVHNIAIETEWEHLWYAYIKPMTSKPSEEDYYQCKSPKYEEACESAIKYCLENLI